MTIWCVQFLKKAAVFLAKLLFLARNISVSFQMLEIYRIRMRNTPDICKVAERQKESVVCVYVQFPAKAWGNADVVWPAADGGQQRPVCVGLVYVLPDEDVHLSLLY